MSPMQPGTALMVTCDRETIRAERCTLKCAAEKEVWKVVLSIIVRSPTSSYLQAKDVINQPHPDVSQFPRSHDTNFTKTHNTRFHRWHSEDVEWSGTTEYEAWRLNYSAHVHSDCLRAGLLGGRSSSPGRIKIFLLFTLARPVLGLTQPPVQWVPGTLSPGVKRPGREAYHSPPTSAEVKKTWIYTSTPPYVFMA
jgi:hypothetical protein